MDKNKAFIAGMKFGAWFCEFWPYAFVSGIFYGFVLYVDRVVKNAQEVERQQSWKARAEAGTYRPAK